MIPAQQFEIWINLSNEESKIVVLMVLRCSQNHKNDKECFSYYESMLSALSFRYFLVFLSYLIEI